MTKFFYYLLFSVVFSLSVQAQLKIAVDGSAQFYNSISGNQTGAVRISANGKYLDIGPKNTSFCHFYSDAPFYLNNSITVNGGNINSYTGQDLIFRSGTTSSTFPSVIIKYGNNAMGINLGPNNPAYTLDVGGQVRAIKVTETSDSTLKSHIKNLATNRISDVYKLDAKTYNFKPNDKFLNIKATKELKDSNTYKFSTIDTTKSMIGLLAQQIKPLYPELVWEDSAGIMSVDYMGLIPVIIEALKAQNTEMKKLKARLDKITTKSIALDELEVIENEAAFLGQNKPNPFNENTTIDFYLPQTVQTAVFCVYDLQGKQIKSIAVPQRENASITLHASELFPGIYYYSLIADGEVIGTEKMILTD